MSDKIIDMKDRVNPARVTDHDTGTVYELCGEPWIQG